MGAASCFALATVARVIAAAQAPGGHIAWDGEWRDDPPNGIAPAGAPKGYVAFFLPKP